MQLSTLLTLASLSMAVALPRRIPSTEGRLSLTEEARVRGLVSRPTALEWLEDEGMDGKNVTDTVQRPRPAARRSRPTGAGKTINTGAHHNTGQVSEGIHRGHSHATRSASTKEVPHHKTNATVPHHHGGMKNCTEPHHQTSHGQPNTTSSEGKPAERISKAAMLPHHECRDSHNSTAPHQAENSHTALALNGTHYANGHKLNGTHHGC